MQMKIHGSFINRLGDTVAVEITTRTGGAADMEIGTEEAGLWFDADAPVAIRAEANGTDDVLLRHSCTIRLLSRSFVPSLFCASCLDAVVMVSSNGRCVFAGYIEPMAYSQPFAEALDTLEINCIDALSALQYFRYGGAGSPDVSFEALKRAARQRSFAHVIKAAIGGVAAGLGGGVRLLYDGSRAIGSDTGAGVLSRLAVSELLFLGDTEDDAWGMDEVVSETLRYLDLHIVQQGTDFLVFSWQTLKAGGGERTIAWHDLGGGSPLATTHRTHAITAATAWGTSAQVSIGEVFSQVLLTCKTTGDGRIIESPLDSKAMAPAYPRRQKYMTTYRSGGEGSTALTAFRAMLMGKGTEYDAAKVTEWYVQVMDAPSWTFYTYDGGRSDMMGLTADGRHQERVAQRLGRAPGAALLSVGQCAVDVAGKDNSPTSPSMSAWLVLSTPLSSPGVTGEARAAADMSLALRACVPMAEYAGNVGGGAFSPSDDAVTNYIVITGRVTLVPRRSVPEWGDLQAGIDKFSPQGPAYPDAWKARWMGKTVGGSYFTRRFWAAETPADEPADDPGGAYGFYPCDEACGKLYEFRYSSIGQSKDNISKVGVLCCMLTIGGKCLVEKGGTGQPGDFEWRDYRPRKACGSDEEYYRQSFTIGIDPKIGDRLIGSEFSVQDNNFSLGIDARGTCIPMRRSDGLNGSVRFTILGPVNTMWKDTRVSREPDFWHHTEWAESSVCLLAHTSAIVVKDLEIRVESDARGGTTADGDIVYMSEARGGFANRKDDVELRIHSALTARECEEMGVANGALLSVAVDTATGVGATTLRDVATGREGKPEQLYVDACHEENSEPRLLLEQEVDDAGCTASMFDRYVHPAIGSEMYVLGIDRDLMGATAGLKLKSMSQ